MPAHQDWEEDDRAMAELLNRRWTHRIGHECGHTTACLAFGHYPDAILLGVMRDQEGRRHDGITIGCSLPEGSSAENQAIVCLAGIVGESLLFGEHEDGADRDLEKAKSYVQEVLVGDSEDRSVTEIEQALIEATERLLRENKTLFDALYEEGLERAKNHGLARLHDEPIELLTGEQIRSVFDWIKNRGSGK